MTRAFQNYDEKGLDAQYDPTCWPGVSLPEVVARWNARTAALYARVDTRLDVPYGNGARQKLDLLLPKASTTSAPVLVFIHGGYWFSRRMDKSNYSFGCEALVDAGALVATVEYDLCPDVSMDTIVRQVREACAWVWRNAPEYGGDITRLHVAGHSAGGHLAAMLAATDWPTFGDGLPRDLVRSAVPISGLFDLEPLRRSFLNAHLRLDEACSARNSPILLRPATRLPMTVVVGGAESDEFRRQSREFVDSWREHLDSIGLIETQGDHHFSIIERMTDSGSELTAVLLGHLGLEAR